MQERKYGHVRTYGKGLERLLAHTYMAGARVHGWVGTEKHRRRRVHGEPTGWVRTECVVVFIGRAWTEQPMETRPGVPQNGRNDLVFDRPRLKRDPVHREGSAYRKTEETDLLRWKRGPVDQEGCGIPQNGGNGPPMVETGVLLIGRGVAYSRTDETDLLRSKRGSC